VVTLKEGMQVAKIAGLIDIVASMHLYRPPPSSIINSNSSMPHNEECQHLLTSANSGVMRNEVTDVGVAKSHVTNRGVAWPVNHHDLDNFHAEYGFKRSPQLDEVQRYKILETLLRYKSVFAHNMTEIKLCKGEPLKLELHTNCKMFKRQFRLSELDKVEMDRQIQQMEKSGVIERSSFVLLQFSNIFGHE